MTDRPQRLGAIHIAITTVALASLGLFLAVSAGASGLSSAAPDPIISERPITAEPVAAEIISTASAETTPPAETAEPGYSAVDGPFVEDSKSDHEERETVRPGIRDEDVDGDAEGDDDKDEDERSIEESSTEESSTDKPRKQKDTSDAEND